MFQPNTLTFLSTDIEGSTRRWDADRDGMAAALRCHDVILREAIRGHEALGAGRCERRSTGGIFYWGSGIEAGGYRDTSLT